MSDTQTIESIQKLRVVDLRERLSKLGLPTAGLKADLVDRLHNALIQRSDKGNEDNASSKDQGSGGGGEKLLDQIKEEMPSSQVESSKRNDGSTKDKSLLDQQKEALAFEQVRLLEQEKAIHETVLLQQGQQQHQMLEEERERQERLEEQKERAMARVQQKMIAREEEEKTLLAHQQHRMLEQQKIMQEVKQEQELMQLQQQALIEKTIEMGGVPPGTIVMATMPMSGPAPIPPVSAPVSMVSPIATVSMVNSVSTVPSLAIPVPTSVPPQVSPMTTTSIPMPMGMPPQPMSAPPQPPMSLTGPPQPPMSMPAPPQPPMPMGVPSHPPMPLSGPPQPPMSIGGPPQPPMPMGGPPQPPMPMGGPPQPPMPMGRPPQPPMSMPGPPMPMGGPPQPPHSMGGPMGGPPMGGPPMGGPQPRMAMPIPPQPPMSMAGPGPGVPRPPPPPHMRLGPPPPPPPSSGNSIMVPTSGPPTMSMGGMQSQRGPPPPPNMMQGPPPPPPPPPMHQGPPPPPPPQNMVQRPPGPMPPQGPHQGPMPPHMMGQQPHPMHSGPPPMQQPPMHQQGFHHRPPPPLHQAPPRGPPMVPPPSRPPGMHGMGGPGPAPPPRGRAPGRMESRDQKEMEDKEEEPLQIQLPHAIEKALMYKSERAQQLGLEPDEVPEPGDEVNDDKSTEEDKGVKSSLPHRPLVAMDEGEDDDMEDEDQPQVSAKVRESKNVRRKKKKRARQNRLQQQKQQQQKPQVAKEVPIGPQNEEVEIVYVGDDVETTDPFYYQFLHIFEKFKLRESDQNKEPELTEEEKKERARQEEQALRLAERKKPADIDEKDDDDDDEKKEEEKPKLSKRKLKKLNRMSIAELKQKVIRPELVEMHDVTAKDPVLLLHLKAARNSVPVPRHWCFKRKYLQGKRGIEKPPFDLPEFIKRTGIMEMRQALQDKEEQKTMKAKMRERVRPKMGKIDIDYQKLHDAFFKWQIKPRMTIHGDIYYEGKEFETRLKEKKPGDLSDDLRVALGMPTGQNAQKCPPPWLIAMQRYGPPPSYPNLKIPGLNAAIPEGCSFGYHAGGWGKPPVDESGRPLYGDVFGTQLTDLNGVGLEEEIDHSLWGELESESSEESEEESSEEEEKQEDETGLVTPAEGLVTPSGLSSVPAGMETPDIIELRKRKIESEMEGGDTPALYTILPEKQTDKVGNAMMGSTHVYDMSAAIQASRAKVSGAVAAMMPPDGVEVTLDPSELEMDSVAMAARYEQTVREQQSQLAKEDLSDMVAEHAARQKNKRKKQQQDSGKTAKKYKEFKF